MAKYFEFWILQNWVNVLFYSYSGKGLDSFNGIRRSVSVDLCKFFNTCCRCGWFRICYPLFRILSTLFFLLKGLLFWLILIFCLSGEELSSISDVRGRCCHLNGCCLNVFPDFETSFFRNFKFQSGKKTSRSVDWARNMCYLENNLQHTVTCVP